MSKTHETRPVVRAARRILAVPALVAVIAVGYAGFRLAPTIHSATSSVTQHVQQADSCLSTNGHC